MMICFYLVSTATPTITATKDDEEETNQVTLLPPGDITLHNSPEISTIDEADDIYTTEDNGINTKPSESRDPVSVGE